MCDCEKLDASEVYSGDDLLDKIPDSMRLRSGYPYLNQGVVEQGIDSGKMTVPFTIVTRQKDVNRNGSKVQITGGPNGDGIKLENYAKNPVIMLDHGYSFPLPIGVSEDTRGNLSVKLYKSKATAVASFSQVLPEAVQTFALIEEGILRTASISFRPLKGILINTDNSDEYMRPDANGVLEFKPWMSWDFTESEMLEWSIVGIPADPDAVRKHLDRGQINGEKITQAMRPVMQGMCENGECSVGFGHVPEKVDRAVRTDTQQSVQDSSPLAQLAYALQVDDQVRRGVKDAFRSLAR